MKKMLLLTVSLMGACGGCGLMGTGDPAYYVKPTIAVIKFENRAPFPLDWDIGDGTREMLVDSLVSTERYRVIERIDIDSILRELRFQHGGATRHSRRVKKGRIQNVQYLVKGTITDFGHVATSRGFLDMLNVFQMIGGTKRAIMGMTLHVIDVESGEIMSSLRLEKSVAAKDVAVRAQYANIALGGSVFYTTPLGRATASVIDEAVREITRVVANQKWSPKVATLQGDGTVVLNGGRNRKIHSGDCYQVRQRGTPIIDPDTEDLLGYSRGKVVGWVRVIKVNELYSIADVFRGDLSEFEPGQICRAGDPPEPRLPGVQTRR